MSMAVVAAHAQRVALYIYVILKLYYIGNLGSRDVKLQVMMGVVVLCERGAVCAIVVNFNLSKDESSSNEGEEIHAT